MIKGKKENKCIGQNKLSSCDGGQGREWEMENNKIRTGSQPPNTSRSERTDIQWSQVHDGNGESNNQNTK